jgi:hypothetical protein
MQAKEPSPAYRTFLDSMKIGLDEWRDGVGYNLVALASVTPEEREELAALLAQCLETAPNWRGIKALQSLGTVGAKSALHQALRLSDLETRMHAAEALVELGEPANLEDVIIEALRKTTLLNGLSLAIDLAEQHPSPRIQEALLERALNGEEDQSIHCAALALYLGGKAEEAFDWNHRPFFLRFGESDRLTRIDAYRELCGRLEIEPMGSILV